MNKIRVCAFLALVVFIGSVVTDMFSGFMDGWNEAGDQKDFHVLPSVSLLVRADDTQSVNIGQTSRREASAGCFHDRENERLLCYFLHPLAGSRKKVTAASSRRFLSTGFKALYGRVFL